MVAANLQHVNQQVRKVLCPQALNPNANYGWPCCSGEHEQRVEIGVQCDHYHAFQTPEVENSRITCCRQASVTHGALQALRCEGEGPLNAGGPDRGEVSLGLRQG